MYVYLSIYTHTHTQTHTNTHTHTHTHTHTQVERVEGQPLSKLLSEYSRDLKAFFRQQHPDRSGPYGIKAEVMDQSNPDL